MTCTFMHTRQTGLARQRAGWLGRSPTRSPQKDGRSDAELVFFAGAGFS